MKSVFKNTILIMLISGTLAVLANDVVVWKFKSGGGITASPTVHDGTVYIGSTDKNFYAIDAATGEMIWQYETGGQIRSNAAVFEEGICFESGNQLVALNFQGELLWQFPLYIEAVHAQYDSWDYVHSSPVIVDGKAYIGTENGLVYGVNIADGTQAFQCQTGTEYGIRVSPVIYENRIYFGDWDGVAYAFDLTTGDKLWDYDTKNDNVHPWMNAIQTKMVIENGVLYFAGRSCNVYALNPADGSLIWKWHSPTDQWMVGGPVIQNGKLYIGSSDQHLFYKFDALTGDKEFECLMDYRVFGGGVVGETCAYMGSRSFYSVNKITGELMKRWPTDKDIVSCPVLSDGVLFFGCNDRYLYALDQQSFDAMLLPQTFIKDETELDLGEIPNQTVKIFQIPIYNSGAGPDSILLSLMGPTKAKRVVTLNEESFIILPGDSAIITGNVAPVELKAGEYTLNLMIHSQYNLEQNDIKKPLKFYVSESTNIEGMDAVKPGSYSLKHNYPNPFNSMTHIAYNLPQSSEVTLTLFDNLGRIVTRLFEGTQLAGQHTIPFDGSHLSSGVYFYVLEANGFTSQHKMILMK